MYETISETHSFIQLVLTKIKREKWYVNLSIFFQNSHVLFYN